MKLTVCKSLRALCGIETKLIRVISIVVMLALAAGMTSVPMSAASNGIYIATATPHYRHPVTGKIEDSGGEGSAVLGQSMTESATYKQALVEVDPQGNTYITVRLKLMDNIQDPQFRLDVDGNGTFTAVTAVLMQEDYTENTADYRMKVPDENVIIRCNMYVVPMGRDVIFYITVSELQSGSGDFVTSVTVENSSQPQLESSEPSTSSVPSEEVVSSDSSESSESAVSEPEESEEPVVSEDDESAVSEPAESEESEEHGASASSGTLGLQEFDASGNKVEASSDEPETSDAEGGTGNTSVWWIVGGVLVVAALAGGIWYFGIYRKRNGA